MRSATEHSAQSRRGWSSERAPGRQVTRGERARTPHEPRVSELWKEERTETQASLCPALRDLVAFSSLTAASGGAAGLHPGWGGATATR